MYPMRRCPRDRRWCVAARPPAKLVDPTLVTRACAQSSLVAPREQVRVVASALGVDAQLVGAAELAFAPLLEDPLATLARTGGDPFSLELVAADAQRLGRRADPADACSLHRLCELGALGEKPVAGMDGVGVGLGRGADVLLGS